jgi:hypothetical protein
MSCLLRLMSGEVGRELASRKQLLAVVERTRNVPKQNKNLYKYLRVSDPDPYPDPH